MLVDLHEQADLPALSRSLARRQLGRRERGDAVIAALEAVAARSRRNLVPFLEEERRAGRVRSWRGFTIVNRLLVEATPSGVEALLSRPEVAFVTPEAQGAAPSLEADPMEGAPEKTSWGVVAIGAEAAWSQGIDGSGIVVGVIDSGATALHEQLAAGSRGGESSWHDPAGGSAAPQDTRFGHGTGVLSAAVGRNVSGVTLGVAPRAQWIACAALPEGRYNNVLATICADWMLTRGRPDVLVNAWVLPVDGCDRSFEPIVAAWRMAGILPVFPAGNRGPAARTDRSPANYPGVLSVGGLARSGGPWESTSQGPSACGGTAFPRLTAPAEDLVAAFPLARDSYLRARGTSFAAGLTAGAAALLLQKHPEASVEEVEEALAGNGRLDVPEAIARLGRRTRTSTD